MVVLIGIGSGENKMIPRRINKSATRVIRMTIDEVIGRDLEFSDLLKVVEEGTRKLEKTGTFKIMELNPNVYLSRGEEAKEIGKKQVIAEMEDYFRLADEITEQLQKYNPNGLKQPYNGGNAK